MKMSGLYLQMTCTGICDPREYPEGGRTSEPGHVWCRYVCAATGKMHPLAEFHASIKGVVNLGAFFYFKLKKVLYDNNS